MFETLFPYQTEGASWLAATPQALLADEMGLGKSAQVVTACDLINASNILVICPAAVRINWTREFERFSPRARPCTVLATGKTAPAPGVNVISYDLLAVNAGLRKRLMSTPWDVLIIDEAQYCKERTAKRTKAIYGHNKHPGLMHSAQRTWRLTGTPAPNNASELFTHLKSAGLELRPYWDFVFDFCTGFDGDYGYKITGHQNTTRLKELLNPFMLRRKKSEVLTQLPPLFTQHVTVERSRAPGSEDKNVAALASLDHELKIRLNAVQSGPNSDEECLNLLGKASQSTATLRRHLGLAKLPSVLEIVEEELSSGAVNKIILFAIHTQVVDQAHAALKHYGAVTLNGGTPTAQRQRNIDAFQNDPQCRVFIGNILAAGTGINLTAAHEVAFIEADWVPANNTQAAMRAHRLGQVSPVRVRFFSCAGSVDETITRVLAHKTREIAKIID